MGERVVMPTTINPNKTLTSPMLLRMAQLSSKYSGTEVDAIADTNISRAYEQRL
jgi:hypothetical protein